MTDKSAMELAGLPAFTELSAEEAQFVYLSTVLQLPLRKAAEMAGLPPNMVSKPHLQQAREMLKREMRGSLPTKEDVAHGMLEAIDRARVLSEPATEIIGWEKVAKLLGYDAPQKIDINITASLQALRQHIGQFDDAQLAEIVGANGVIDGDFYRVESSGGAG